MRIRAAAAVLLGLSLLAGLPEQAAGGSLEWGGWLRIGTYYWNELPVTPDQETYLGAQGELHARWLAAPGLSFYLSALRHGGSDYDAPLTQAGVGTLYGRRYRLSGQRWLPRMDQASLSWWGAGPWSMTLGLFRPLALGAVGTDDVRANYGASLAAIVGGVSISWSWRHPGWNNRWDLGERPKGDEAFTGKQTNAEFWQMAAVASSDRWRMILYTSILDDRTAAQDRIAAFNLPVTHDQLGLAGAAVQWSSRWLNVSGEAAQNFGSATGAMAPMTHAGWLVQAEVHLTNGWLDPGIRYLRASGHSMSRDEYYTGEADLSRNEAFSYYSPANLGMFDSRYPAFIGPILATGSGYGYNFGIPRPSLFGDPHLPENLEAIAFMLDLFRFSRWSCRLQYWTMSCDATPWGMLAEEPVALPKDLGGEWDISGSYQLSANWTINLLGGAFHPGRYYTAARDDEDPYLLYPRWPGSPPEWTYQLELGLEWKR